jgi:hypothetical protein
MDNRLNIEWNRIGKKWVACFDLLGFSELVKDINLVNVFYRWEVCLNELHTTLKRYPTLGFAHFSDTFLIYAPDASKNSFVCIEGCSRWFFQYVILRQFPLRGALACDEFYADKPNGVFLGKALVEAHEFGEQFNWIGYTLCPSALSRFQDPEISFPPCPANYRRSDVPTKSGMAETVALLCGSGRGRDYIQALEEMKRLAIEDLTRKQRPPELISRVTVKYNNSIGFIKQFEVTN